MKDFHFPNHETLNSFKKDASTTYCLFLIVSYDSLHSFQFRIHKLEKFQRYRQDIFNNL